MKKITIIFIIVLCLLSFMEISYFAEEPFNWGEFWKSIPEPGKVFYISGFRRGIGKCLRKLEVFIKTEDMFDAFMELYELYDFIRVHDEEVMNVMNDLYKDPANTYIFHSEMIEIAYQKLKGEDIEPLLQEARKKALP